LRRFRWWALRRIGVARKHSQKMNPLFLSSTHTHTHTHTHTYTPSRSFHIDNWNKREWLNEWGFITRTYEECETKRGRERERKMIVSINQTKPNHEWEYFTQNLCINL
jgi:hypothetical protein